MRDIRGRLHSLGEGLGSKGPLTLGFYQAYKHQPLLPFAGAQSSVLYFRFVFRRVFVCFACIVTLITIIISALKVL